MGSCRCHNRMDTRDPSGGPQQSPSHVCNSVFHSPTAGLVAWPRLLPAVPAQLLCNAPGSAWEPLLHAAWCPCGQSCLHQPASVIVAVFSVPCTSSSPSRTPNGLAGYEKCLQPNSALLSTREGMDEWMDVHASTPGTPQPAVFPDNWSCLPETPIPQRNMGEPLPACWS